MFGLSEGDSKKTSLKVEEHLTWDGLVIKSKAVDPDWYNRSTNMLSLSFDDIVKTGTIPYYSKTQGKEKKQVRAQLKEKASEAKLKDDDQLKIDAAAERQALTMAYTTSVRLHGVPTNTM